MIATQNPIEYEGTYPLPEAQLDRFMLRTTVGYPSHDDEWDLLARRMERGTTRRLSPIIDPSRASGRCRRRWRPCTSTK